MASTATDNHQSDHCVRLLLVSLNRRNALVVIVLQKYGPSTNHSTRRLTKSLLKRLNQLPAVELALLRYNHKQETPEKALNRNEDRMSHISDSKNP